MRKEGVRDIERRKQRPKEDEKREIKKDRRSVWMDKENEG